jgi:hypothetical protein
MVAGLNESYTSEWSGGKRRRVEKEVHMGHTQRVIALARREIISNEWTYKALKLLISL